MPGYAEPSALVWYRSRSVVGLLPRGWSFGRAGVQREISAAEAEALVKGRAGSFVSIDGELYRVYLLGDEEAGAVEESTDAKQV